MSNAYINSFSYALGDQACQLEVSANQGRLLSSPQMLRDGGFVRHHFCSDSTSAYDLAKRTVDQLAVKSGDLGAIVYSTCIPANGNMADPIAYSRSKDVKHLMDFPASHLMADFGFERANVFGLTQQACTGMLGSMRMAQMILHSEPQTGEILCVSADRFPKDAKYEQAYCLISDGAAACVVSQKPTGYRILATHAITNGALALASDDEIVGSFFSYTVATLTGCLKKAQLSVDEVDWIIPQNTNKRAWQILASVLDYDFARVQFPTIGDIGHVISGDCIVNLKHLQDSGSIQAGDKILLSMSGLGMNWQCVLLERV